MVFTGAQARRRLDARMERLRALAGEPRPHRGWIRAIRDALGMSSTELAGRMGVSQTAVPALERSEMRGSVKLATLQRAADALDCDLVYALVPRRSLEEAVKVQAQRKAERHLRRVAHHSRLEDQTVAEDEAVIQRDELAERFIDRRGLWSEPVLR